MILARVAGRVVTGARSDGMEDSRYLLVKQCMPDGSGETGGMVALDIIGAAPGELVLVSQGSSTRQTEITDGKPVDALIIGIVDMVEENSRAVYR